MKNELESTGNRADQMEERICKLEDRNLEMIQEEREIRFFFKMSKFYNSYLILLGRATLGLVGIPEEKGTEFI